MILILLCTCLCMTGNIVFSYPLQNQIPVNNEYAYRGSIEDPWILFRQPRKERIDSLVLDSYKYEVAGPEKFAKPVGIVIISNDESESESLKESSNEIEITTKMDAEILTTTELPVPISEAIFKTAPLSIGSGLAVGGVAGAATGEAPVPEVETTNIADIESTSTTESPKTNAVSVEKFEPGLSPIALGGGLAAGGSAAGLAADTISNLKVKPTTPTTSNEITTKRSKVSEWPYDAEDTPEVNPAATAAIGTGLAAGGIASVAGQAQTTTLSRIETTTELTTTTTELPWPTVRFENPSGKEGINIGTGLAAGGAAGAATGAVAGNVGNVAAVPNLEIPSVDAGSSGEPTMKTMTAQLQALQQTATTNLGFSIFSAIAAIIQILLLILMSELRIKKIITIETERVDKNVEKHCGDIKEKLDKHAPAEPLPQVGYLPPTSDLAMYDYGPFQPPEIPPPLESEVAMQENKAEEYQSAPPPPAEVDDNFDSLAEERDYVDQDFLSMAPQVESDEEIEEPPPRDQGFFSLALQEDSDEEAPPQEPEPVAPAQPPPSPKDHDMLSLAFQTSDDETEPEPQPPAEPEPERRPDQDMLSLALQGESEEEPDPEPPKVEPPPPPPEPPKEEKPHHSRSPSPRGRGRGHRSRSRSHSPRGRGRGLGRGDRPHSRSPPKHPEHEHEAPHHGPGPARRSLRGFMPTGAHDPHQDEPDKIHKTHGARPPRPSAEELAKRHISSHLAEL